MSPFWQPMGTQQKSIPISCSDFHWASQFGSSPHFSWPRQFYSWNPIFFPKLPLFFVNSHYSSSHFTTQLFLNPHHNLGVPNQNPPTITDIFPHLRWSPFFPIPHSSLRHGPAAHGARHRGPLRRPAASAAASAAAAGGGSGAEGCGAGAAGRRRRAAVARARGFWRLCCGGDFWELKCGVEP